MTKPPTAGLAATDAEITAALADLIDDVPGELHVVAEITDVETAYRIADAFGGRQMDIPASPLPAHPLFELLGEAKARKVWEVFGGGRVRWPLAKHLRIKWMWIAGERTDVIVDKVGCSDATIYACVKGLPRHAPERRRSRLALDADARASRIQARLRKGDDLGQIAKDEGVTRAAARDLARRPLAAPPAEEPSCCPSCGRRLPRPRAAHAPEPPPVPLFERFGRFLPVQPKPLKSA